MTDIADTPLRIDAEMLTRLAAMTEPHSHELLEQVRAEFGDDAAPTLFVTAIGVLLGAMLTTIPNAIRVPDAFALVWGLMGVPFTLDTRRVQ
jgi:hypothetical protein